MTGPPVDLVQTEEDLDAVFGPVDARPFTRSVAPARRFTLLDDSEIANLPTPEQLIDGVLPCNALAVMFGEKGSLKTFLALDIAAHVSLGLDWHGRTVKPGTVVYVYAEGRTGLGPRLDAWKRFHGVQDLGILFLTQRITVNETRDCLGLLNAIEERLGMKALGAVSLIIIDTLNRNSTGNENSTEDMSAIVRGCDALRERTGATILLTHHKGHAVDERGRGSSVLDAAADTVLAVSRDDDRLTVECKKQKDGPEFGSLAFQALTVVGSLVLKPSGVAEGGLKGQRLQLLTSLLENTTDEGLRYSAWQEASRVKSQSSFGKALDWLKANGYVHNVRGRWKPTDSGLLALHTTNTTAAPPTASGVRSNTTPPRGGYTHTPAVVQDSNLPLGRGEAWEPGS